MADLIQLRRDTAANWTSADTLLAQGEAGFELGGVTVKMKVGDGTTPWTSLPYVSLDGTDGMDGADGISFIWMDAYDAGTAYVPNDVVAYLGSVYICTAPSTGNLPTDAAFFDLMVSKGDTGATGSTGAPGMDGSDGTDGTDGSDGADGISFIWRGAYSGVTAYVANDTVSYLGSSYICIASTTGNAPTDPTKWSLMASKGDTGAAGTNGSNGTNGSDGAAGRNVGLKYTYDSTTTSGDPGSGKFRWNHATPASATALYISETDGDAAGIAALIATWDDGTSTIHGNITFRKDSTPATFITFNVTGTNTDGGSWDTLTIAHIASNGTISNTDVMKVTFDVKGDKGDTGATGSTGGNGTNGTNGTDGRDAGIKYTYDSTTTASDPGSGKFRLNNATISLATSLFISETDGDAASVAAWIATLDDSTTTGARGIITFRKRGTPGSYAQFQITSAATDSGAWDTFTVSYIGGAGPLANNDICNVEFARTGDKGDTGATGGAGGTGSTGATGRDAGIKYTYDSTTTSGDPGSGKFRLNNATVASATALYINETDGDGAGIAAWLALFDDSTTITARGVVTFRKQGTPANYAQFQITSAITDNGSWDTFTVSYIGGNGPIVATDVCNVEFARTGDKGTTGTAGADGISAGRRWTYKNPTTIADPSNGNFRMNSLTFASVTSMAIAEIDLDVGGNGLWINDWSVGGSTSKSQIKVQKVSDPSSYQLYNITAGTDNGTWDTLTLVYVGGSGSFTDGDVCYITNTKVGDKGTTGDAGRNTFRNLLFNGNFNLWQRATSFAAIGNNAYAADRWIWAQTSAGFCSILKVATQSDNQSSAVLQVDVTTADTSVAAGDVMFLSQRIEGYNFLAGAGKTMTLSFFVNSTTTGTYCVAFRNASGNKSYVATYTINVANAWEKKTITFTHDITGTWDYTTGIGLVVSFCLMGGSTFQTTANAWQTGNFLCTSAQTNLFASTSNNWYISEVQLEVGSTASDFEQIDYGTEKLRCQRYYERSYPDGTATGATLLGPVVCICSNGTLAGSTAGNVIVPFNLGYKAEKRVAPTVTMYDIDGTANAARIYPLDAKRAGLTVNSPLGTGTCSFLTFDTSSTTAVANGSFICAHWTSEAEL